MSKFRNWCFTLNNPKPEDKDKLLEYDKCKYIKFQLEKGENGTPHYQGLIIMKNACRMKTMKSIDSRIHWEPMKSLDGSIAYCEKDDTREDGPWESGIPPKSGQGKRKDLDELKEQIMEGTKTVDDIVLDNPEIYHKYGRTLHKIEDLALRKQTRTWMTEGIWYWGETGVGKSHLAFEGYTPETHYVWKDDNGWQDGYTGQEIVIINDFRGHIKYDEMLQMVDKWPHYVRRRGREPAPFLARKVIITSSLRPEQVYCNRNVNDSIQQLLRRMDVLEIKTQEG